jgi:hypothetical protein
VHEVSGIIVIHGDFFEDHSSFSLDVLGANQRIDHDIAHDIYRERQVLVQYPRVVTRVFLGGERVQIATHGLDGC